MLTELFAVLPEDPYEYMSQPQHLQQPECCILAFEDVPLSFQASGKTTAGEAKYRVKAAWPYFAAGQDMNLAHSGVLWVLLPGGNPM